MRLITRWRVTTGVCVAVAALLCAPRAVATEQDRQAKTFAPAAGKAAIYVYRKKSGNILSVPVKVDGKHLGDMGKGDYYWIEVEPGEHEVRVGFEYGSGPHAKVKVIPISAQAGQSYFVRVNITFAHDKHEAVDSQTGKTELLACCTLAVAVESK